jgi:hypothetical protein
MAKNLHADVIQKALSDPRFKAALLEDPAAAVEKATGVKIPPGLRVVVVEDTPSVVHLVLPGVAAKGTLTDAELGRVAGGGSVPGPVPFTFMCVNCSNVNSPGC